MTLKRKENGALIRHGFTGALCTTCCFPTVVYVSALGVTCRIDLSFNVGLASGSWTESYSAPRSLDRITWLPDYTDPGHTGLVTVSVNIQPSGVLALYVETAAVWPATGGKYAVRATFNGVLEQFLTYGGTSTYGSTGRPVGVTLGDLPSAVAMVTAVEP